MSLDTTNDYIVKLAQIAGSRVGMETTTAQEWVVHQVSRPNTSREALGWQEETLLHHQRDQSYSLGAVESALYNLVSFGVIKVWQPSGATLAERPRFYQLTPEFLLLAAKCWKESMQKPSRLLEANIKVKGTEITLSDLAAFNTHVPWLLDRYPNLKDIFIGINPAIRLSREEAAILLGEIEKHNLFDKG